MLCCGVCQKIFGEEEKLFYLEWAAASNDGPSGLLLHFYVEVVQQTMVLSLVAILPRTVLAAALRRHAVKRIMHELWENKIIADGLICLDINKSTSPIDIRRALLGSEAACRIVARLSKSFESQARLGACMFTARKRRPAQMPGASKERDRVKTAGEALQEYCERLRARSFELLLDNNAEAADGASMRYLKDTLAELRSVTNVFDGTRRRSSGFGARFGAISKRHSARTPAKRTHPIVAALMSRASRVYRRALQDNRELFNMVVLGALPRDELQTTLQDCRLMASLPLWWQRALFKTFLLEQSKSMMLIQTNPFGNGTSGALVLGVALYFIICIMFVVSFHLDQNSQQGVVANQAVYIVALLNLSIDAIFISPIALLLQNIVLPALVSRMLRRPLSIGMQDIVQGNQVGVDQLSAVLSAKRAGERWLAHTREKRDVVQQHARRSIVPPEDNHPEVEESNDPDFGADSSRESSALGFDEPIFGAASEDHFTACNPMVVDPSSRSIEMSRSIRPAQYDEGTPSDADLL